MNNMEEKLIVDNVKITEYGIKYDKYLTDVISMMEEYGINNPKDLLPKSKWYELEFNLKNTYSGFANGIRRALTEELPVLCLDFKEESLETDDEFILHDLLIKNMNLIPINQEIKSDLNCSISIRNMTNEIIDIKASDIKNAEKIIPDPNIVLIRLRPGKYLKIKSIFINKGYGKDNMAKFSLLNNIRYDIIDKVDKRSIEYDPKEFKITITTAANISIKRLMFLLEDELVNRLNNIKEKIKLYMGSDQSKKYYFSNGLEVTIINGMYVYKITGEYITLAYMIGQRCFLLDRNILFCAPSIDRYDNDYAIIKLKHADPNKLLMMSIDNCINDIKLLSNKVVMSGRIE